jgi:ubiquitin-conjugating enzyme E2 G2
MSSIAIKRLMTEYRELVKNPVEGISAGPIKDDNYLIWDAKITGPPGTPFEGGIFPAILTFSKDYPLSPPTMRFTCEIFHPNGIASKHPNHHHLFV